MAILQQSRAGCESSITSIASGSNSQSILNANYEITDDASGAVLKVRKPYTMSKQREKWTEDEHQKFIEAIKLYGRAWRQIEEYIGTKNAVQIRSHAQKFFSKVMKEGAGRTDTSTKPIEIPPPRPKRKPLHPYPRKLVESSTKTQMCPGLKENIASTNLKTSEREAHSPISVLSPEGSQISISEPKDLGSGCVSRTSSGSNLSHIVEKNNLMKENDNSTTVKEKGREGNLSLALNLSGPMLDDSTLMSATKECKAIHEDNSSETGFKFIGGGGTPLKIIKLFGHTVVVANQMETNAPVAKLALNLKNQLVPGDILMGEISSEEGSKGFSSTASISNSFNRVKYEETTLNSVNSKIEHSQQSNISPNNFRKGFVPYKRCVSDREASSLTKTVNGRESQRIRVNL